MRKERSAPEITILSRLGSSPIISSLLDILANNAYTRQPYTHFKQLAQKFYILTTPVQVIFSPLIIYTDSIANKGVDVLDSTFTLGLQSWQKNLAGGLYSSSFRQYTGLLLGDMPLPSTDSPAAPPDSSKTVSDSVNNGIHGEEVADCRAELSESLTILSPPSNLEANFYYTGLPSNPVLVARTGPPWKAPSNPEVYLKAKELRAVGSHMLEEVWEDNLAFKLHALLNSMKVKWTSTDVVRIWNTAESSSSVILWIGVIPASLSGDDGVVVASMCLDLLRQNNITDVEVEIRESIVTSLDGPKFLPSDLLSNPTIDVREPLTTMLPLPICSQSMPWAEGSGGFFIAEDGKPERLLLVTARHVVFKVDRKNNEHFECKNNGQCHCNVMLFGDRAFKKYLRSIEKEINECASIVTDMEARLVAVKERDDSSAIRERRTVQPLLDSAREAQEELKIFYQDVSIRWGPPANRVIGHVTLSPPLKPGFGDGYYTEDWAVIEIDTSKVDASNFQGNVIDLGSEFSSYQVIRMMNPKNATQTFKYPHSDRLLRLCGTIPDKDFHKPTALDKKSDPCLMVLKRGSGGGLTIGRSNNIVSYKRYCFPDDEYEWSKEWAILPYDSKSGAFSTDGDSGSVVVDGLGRIGGLLTAGSRRSQWDSVDITYVTPISFLLKRMQENGLHMPNVNPTLNQ